MYCACEINVPFANPTPCNIECLIGGGEGSNIPSLFGCLRIICDYDYSTVCMVSLFHCYVHIIFTEIFGRSITIILL